MKTKDSKIEYLVTFTTGSSNNDGYGFHSLHVYAENKFEALGMAVVYWKQSLINNNRTITPCWDIVEVQETLEIDDIIHYLN